MDGQENDFRATAALSKKPSHIQSAQLVYENVKHHDIGSKALAFTDDGGSITESSNDFVRALSKQIADVIKYRRIIVGED
jgi:hypothetical protein